jgi:hypothetical protein
MLAEEQPASAYEGRRKQTMREKEATSTKEATPTRQEYEVALAELEKMKHRGGMLHVFATHMHTALSYELAHGIRPTAWERIG